MNSWEFYAALALVAFISPFFWLAILTPLLWLGRKYLSHKVGRALFGHFWNKR